MFLASLHIFVEVSLLTSTCAEMTLIEMSHPYNNETVSPPNPALWKYEILNFHKGEWEGHGDIWYVPSIV